MSNKLEELLNNFNNTTEKPENFLSTEADRSNSIRFLVKNAYDFTKLEEENTRKSQALPELIIENFDLEQIWQQIELQNEDLLNKSLIRVSKFAINKNRLIFEELDKDLPPDKEEEDEVKEKLDSETDDNESETSNDENDKFDDNQGDAASDTEEEDDKSSVNDESGDNERIKSRKSIVDDDFFKLDEMEKFLKSEEKDLNKKSDDDSGNESKDEDEEIDYFKGDDDDGEEDENDEANLREKNPRYKDFFQSNETEKPTKRNKFLEENADDEESIPNEPKSTFELREERLNKKIKILEDIVLSEKPWQLQGEITAENRPQNSLLEEIVEFDLTSRPAPVITEKTTFQLEDVIRQRIKDKAFDSVERKEKPVETPLEYKKKLVLDQEKSKQSLAQIYEKEYLQQVETAAGDVEDKDEEPESHKEIKKMMQILFRQLDALSNYHFTPKPAAPELRIVSNLPAINMEEVAPIAATDASLLAPEEVKGRIKGDIIGKNERSDADKNRERRKKKRKQKIHANERVKRENMVNKLNPGLGNKYSKAKAQKELEKVVKDKNVDKMDESAGTKHIKSSSAFFKQLEEEVKSHIKVKTAVKRKQNPNELNAKRLKL